MELTSASAVWASRAAAFLMSGVPVMRVPVCAGMLLVLMSIFISPELPHPR